MKNSINVCINGKSKVMPAGSILLNAIEVSGVQEPFAVAVNNVLVTKAEYGAHVLNDGDAVEIVYPIQGG